MNNFLRFPLCLLCTVLFLSSCDQIASVISPNWLVGTWVLDREKTVEAFTQNNQRETPAGGIAGELAAAAIRKSVDSMAASLADVKFVFTETEMSDGGSPRSYEIVNRPNSNEIKILDSNDNVRVYYREEDRIWYYLTGKNKFQIYLKPFGQ